MRDVVKSRDSSQNGGNRKRRRRRQNLSLYYTAVFFLVIVVGIILSLTVFFNVTEVTVDGESIYSSSEIIAASKIKSGDNLVRLNSSKAENSILKSLVYIDTATVSKKFPDKVEITVTPSEEFANVEYGSGYLLISKNGKILSFLQTAAKDYPVIKGCETINSEPGSFIKCEDEEKEKAFYFLVETMLAEGVIEKITLIDISDRYNLSVEYDDRITVELGSQNDLAYKLRFSYMLVNEKISINKRGKLYMKGNNSNEASFVEEVPVTTAPETSPDTETTGNTDNQGEEPAETTAPPETTVTEETTAETTTAVTESLPPVGIVPSVQ